MPSHLYIIEPNKPGGEHASFNAATISMLAAGARKRGLSIVVACEANHWDNIVRRAPTGPNVTWREIKVISGFKRAFTRKFANECIALFKTLRAAQRDKAPIVVLSLFPNTLVLMLLLSRVIPMTRVHIFLHAEVESLTIADKQSIRREGFWTSAALLRLFDGTGPHLYILGNGLKARLMGLMPQHRQFAALRAIEHPYVFSPPQADAARTGPVRVGFIGAGRAVKGIREFCDLAKRFSSAIASGAIEFVVVGGVERMTPALNTSHVRVLAGGPGELSTRDYEDAVRQLDVALFLYRQDYQLTASGAVFDAMNGGLKIVTLPNHYIKDLAVSDEEQGISFYATVSDISDAIQSMLEAEQRPARYSYWRIRQIHSNAVREALEAAVFSTPGNRDTQ